MSASRRGRTTRSALAITDDVRGDLDAAAVEGVGPLDLLEPDVDAFGRPAMRANGVESMAGDYPRLAERPLMVGGANCGCV